MKQETKNDLIAMIIMFISALIITEIAFNHGL